MLHVAYYGPKKQLIYHPYLTAQHYLKVSVINIKLRYYNYILHFNIKYSNYSYALV